MAIFGLNDNVTSQLGNYLNSSGTTQPTNSTPAPTATPYLSQLSPDVLKQLTTDPNAKWTDPNSGWVYYGNWSAPTQGNDENPALPATFLGNLLGIPSLNAADGSDLAGYNSTGAFTGLGKTGTQTDFMDRVAPFMAAGILGAGLGAGMGMFGEGAGAAGATGEAAGGSGAFLGEGAVSGVPAWDAALASAPAWSAAGAGTGLDFSQGFTDTGTAGGALDTGYAGSGAVTGATGSVLPAGVGPATSAVSSGAGSVFPSLPTGSSSLLSTISSLLGNGSGGTSGSGFNLSNLGGLLSGAYGASQQTNSANSMLDYLKQRQSLNDNMYAPGSPEYNALWDEMSRKDAAAGRNSQYGPRSVDLAARIAQLKMNSNTQLTSNIAKYMADSLNQKANAGANVTSMLPALLGGGNSGSGLSLSQLTNWLNSFGTPNSYIDPSILNPDGAVAGLNIGGIDE